ncbi:MAG: hypothetical protein AAGF98_06360 [Cyanobacteria bacterium P01_H01_bin.153]
MNKLNNHTELALLLLLIGVSLSTAGSFLIASPWITPFLGAAGAYPVFIAGIRGK